MKLLFFLFLMMGAQLIPAQMRVIVQDRQGEVLPYAEVFSEDYRFTTTTDQYGEVEIPDNLEPTTALVFSYVGYQDLKVIKKDLPSVVILEDGLVLEEVTLVGRTNNRAKDMASKVESINAKVFQITNPQTSADALAQHADVYVQKSQMGGGSPVIRGFEANKVLLVVDGVRMNNAIYRSGHLQNAITVDPSILERLEVLYGPGSLMYGSDAIGGVVHFRTKEPKLNFDPEQKLNTQLNAWTRYATANKERSVHADLNLGGERLASFTSLTYSRFGDLRTGANRTDNFPNFGKRLFYAERQGAADVLVNNEDPNVQVGTGYGQFDVLQKVLFQANDQLRFVANVQLSTSTDIPRYDLLTEPDGSGGLNFAEWYYGPQNRFFFSLKAEHKKSNRFYDKWMTILSYQRIDEDRIDRRFGSLFRSFQFEDVAVYSLTLDFTKNLDPGGTFEFNYGAEVNYNTVESSAKTVNIMTNSVGSNLTRYPSGGSHTNNVAAYALLRKTIGKHNLFSGFRYSNNAFSVRYDRADDLPWPEAFYDGVTGRNDAISWSLGGNFSLGPHTKLQAQYSTAFRSPNVDDVAKIRVKANEISVPNLELQPETSRNAEITVNQKIAKGITVGATGFYTQLNNAVVREDFALPDGTTFLVDEGDSLRIVGNVNADVAKVYGVSANIKAVIADRLEARFSINYIEGTSQNEAGDTRPLGHIPPLYGRFNLNYEMKGSSLNYVTNFNGAKPLEDYGGTVDNPEQATADGTLSFVIHNLYYKRNVTKRLSATVAIENILDTHYRAFASGVSGAGRNLIIGLRMNL